MPSGSVRIKPAPEPSEREDPSVISVHGCGRISFRADAYKRGTFFTPFINLDDPYELEPLGLEEEEPSNRRTSAHRRLGARGTNASNPRGQELPNHAGDEEVVARRTSAHERLRPRRENGNSTPYSRATQATGRSEGENDTGTARTRTYHSHGVGVDAFAGCIRRYSEDKKRRMPTNVKTYDGIGDQSLYGATCSKLQLKSKDNQSLYGATWFRGVAQRKKYSKNPVELARIRQRSGESLDSFTERFKDEMVYFKHCPDLMKISAYMNGINNQDLIKKLNDKVSQTFDELMRRVWAFIRAEDASADSRRGYSCYRAPDQPKKQLNDRGGNRRYESRNQQRSEGRKPGKFTPLTMTLKEVFAAEGANWPGHHRSTRQSGIKAIEVVPTTAHGMLKFPADGGIVTIYSTTVPPECNTDPKEEHQLHIRDGYPPVRQKKRGQERKMEEVNKLVKAGIMREVHYHDWLSNPVMVKKHDGGWRMCMDFTDLNKACPQDCYPLPEIDWKVESLEMNDNEWQLHDRALLTMFGDVRHGDDTSLNITVEDIALRVVRFREIFQSNPTGTHTHSIIEGNDFGLLLTRCFGRQDPNLIQVPKNLLPISNGRSWLSTSGCNASSQSVGQAPTVASPTQDRSRFSQMSLIWMLIRTIKEAESIVADVTTCYLAELEGANQKEAESIVADVGKFFQTTES
ncbi:hypothetical protein Tco_0046347 [Tanacetum coccineum]